VLKKQEVKVKKFKSIGFFLAGFVLLFASLEDATARLLAAEEPKTVSAKDETDRQRIEVYQKKRKEARERRIRKMQNIGDWRICGDCHRCQNVSRKTPLGDEITRDFTCYPKVYKNQYACQSAAKRIKWITGHPKPC